MRWHFPWLGLAVLFPLAAYPCAKKVLQMNEPDFLFPPEFGIEALTSGVLSARPHKLSGYAATSLSIGTGIATEFPLSSEPHTVLYPFSGDDAATGFLVFPNARQVIAIDEHPFISGKHFNPTHVHVLPNSGPSVGYVEIKIVHIREEIAPSLLGFLFHSIPGARIKRLAVIWETGEGEKVWTHGLCEFDTGENTPLRRIFQIHSGIQTDFSKLWWSKELERIGVGALIGKAAMQHHTETRAAAAPFFQWALNLLADGQGLLIEGHDQNRFRLDHYEVTGYHPLPSGVRADERRFGHPWGYFRGVKATALGR